MPALKVIVSCPLLNRGATERWYTDSIDFKSKQEAERSLGRFFLINIDEFDQINANQQGFLKHLLQKPVANLRKPYGTTIQEMRRYASFIGTSNLKDLLTDPSGSRRFICIEVTDSPLVLFYVWKVTNTRAVADRKEIRWMSFLSSSLRRESAQPFVRPWFFRVL